MVGTLRHSRNLVCQLASGVHVFESFLVACTLSLRCRTVLLVLAPDERAPQLGSMDLAWPRGGTNGQCVLPERDRFAGARVRIRAQGLARTSAAPKQSKLETHSHRKFSICRYFPGGTTAYARDA